jgi:putative radical SAM enzyme (TIGR03279 family)
MYEFAVTPAVTQIRRPGVMITAVEPEGLGAELGLEPNDRIVRVNGHLVRDYLDFRFQTAGETELTLVVKKASGETWEIEVERNEAEDFGLIFEQIVPRQCANDCIFCFCKGNPKTARPSLFVRDEDIRLSFLYGNYTTLTSVTQDELNRIVRQRLSPQYVSIHATDLKTRAYLLGVSEKRADISDKLKFLLDNSIEIHAQIVLCPKINDGEILRKTLFDLAEFYPKIVSVAIVPVALTRYNTDERLARVTPEFCKATVKQVEKFQKEFRRRLGTTFAFLADEIYIKAGLKIPSRRHYGDYPQIEDGVGMIRTFLDSFKRFLRRLKKSSPKGIEKIVPKNSRGFVTQDCNFATNPGFQLSRGGFYRTVYQEILSRSTYPKSLHGTILTGEMFAPVLSQQIESLNRLMGSKLEVMAVPNTYFGGDVAVAGLLTGQDFVAFRKKVKGDFVIIPQHTIKSDEPLFLDGMTFDELCSNFTVPIYPLDLKEFMKFVMVCKGA